MKNIWLAGTCLIGVYTGCINKDIKLDVDAGSIKTGVFTVADEGHKMIDAKNLENGQSNMKFNALEPGYYLIHLSDNKTFADYQEIYLEPGQYNIKYTGTNPKEYPQIKTNSETQKELSLFHEELAAGKTEAAAIQHLFRVKKAPQSGFHLLEKLDLKPNPELFLKMYRQLPAEVKETNRGKYLGEQLTAMVNMQEGKKAPPLVGKTPDGRPFHFIPKKTTKLIIVAFWKSGNVISRQNNQILAQINNRYGNKGAEVISVSSDTKPLWFSTAVKDDHMAWHNVSDLKGSRSVNLANYNVTTIPSYMLLKRDFTIIDNDVVITSLPGVLSVSLN